MTKLKILYKWIELSAIICCAIISICLLVTAYSGYLNPENYPKIAVAGMAFPIFLIAQLFIVAGWLIFRKWKMSITFGAVIILCGGPIITYCPLNLAHPKLSASEEKTKFTVLTYNVYAFYDFKDRNVTDYNITVSNILKVDADIVCLQECYSFDADKGTGVTKIQSDSLKMKYPYREIAGRDIGILSKFPIIKAETIRDDQNDFGFGKFTLNLKGDTVSVYSVHLQSIGLTQSDKELYRNLTSVNKAQENIDSIKQKVKVIRNQLYHKLALAMQSRARQSKFLRNDISAQKGDVILCGDFNDTPNSFSYREVKGNMSDAYSKCGFGPCITYHANRFYFRIDQVFYKGNIKAVDIECPKFDSSDHYPLFVEFIKTTNDKN